MKFKFTEAEVVDIVSAHIELTENPEYSVSILIDRIEQILSSRAAADQAGAEEVLKECWEEWRKRFSDNKIIAYCDIMYDAKEMYMIPAMMTFAKQKVAEAVEAKDAEMEKVREDEYQYHFYKRTKMLKVVRNFRDKVLSLKSEITESKRRVAELEEAVRWALGETDFPIRKEGEGPYWWRIELRQRANIKPQ